MSEDHDNLPPTPVFVPDRTRAGVWRLYPADIEPVTSAMLTQRNWDNTCGVMCPECGELTGRFRKHLLPLGFATAPFAAFGGHRLAQVHRCPFCYAPSWHHVSPASRASFQRDIEEAVRVRPLSSARKKSCYPNRLSFRSL